MSPAVYVITGGTRGIGAAVARALAVPGNALVLGYRADDAAAQTLVAELDDPGHPVLAQRCDVADPMQVAALFDTATGQGTLTGLVNSAGILETQHSFTEIDAERWQRVLATNVIGTALCCREFLLRATDAPAPDRAIVNLSSRAAVLGSPNEYVDYAASKAAVDTLTRGLALEDAGQGVRVNAVRPGIIETDIHASGGDPGRAARLGPGLPMRRAGRANEVADAVVWLLSSQASYVTGTTIDVSGGR